jgi:hypothetical protein
MRRRIEIATILTLVSGLSNLAARAEDRREGRTRPLILAHYMPWYEAKPTGGHWGWHWTMGRYDPGRTDPTGRREIASHYYPLIGPYDSADPDLLEYHTLLLKVAGIDGVVADWYGSEDVNDYAVIHRRTEALFEAIKRRGLKIAVRYEDRALRAISEKQKPTPEQAVEHGRGHLRFCEDHWFEEPAYVTLGGKPLLLVFGPDYLGPVQWEAVFKGPRKPPALFSLHERRPPAIGSFAWPAMWAAKGGVLDAGSLDEYLHRFYGREGPKVGCAFLGFRDIYAQAVVRPSYGFLDPRDGETFRLTPRRAVESGCPIIQVATWNDFGEGTCVEPAREYGYRYLEAIQEARRRSPGVPFVYGRDDLGLPLRIYRLRKRIDRPVQGKAIDEVVDLLSAGQVARASGRLGELEAAAPQPEGAGARDAPGTDPTP